MPFHANLAGFSVTGCVCVETRCLMLKISVLTAWLCGLTRIIRVDGLTTFGSMCVCVRACVRVCACVFVCGFKLSGFG